MPAKRKEQSIVEPQRMAAWTFLSNHAHVLLCIARHHDIRLRDVAAHVGITERAVQRIVTDLEQEGYLSRTKNGRRNQYQLHRTRPLRHRLEGHRLLEDILSLAEGGNYQAPTAGGPSFTEGPTPRLRRAGT